MLLPLPDQIPALPSICSVAILGSTGSIGTSTLSVIRNSKRYSVFALSAHSNTKLLSEQIKEFSPRYAYLENKAALPELINDLGANSSTKILQSEQEFLTMLEDPECPIVVAAVVGVAGLIPVLKALEHGKRVCLANKESLVAGGQFVTQSILKAKANGLTPALIPIDSEHSALFQCAQALYRNNRYCLEELKSLVITASGGPFLNTPLAALSKVTPEQAVKHPRWSMGAKISIDSATLANKALELIEAHWLFGTPAQALEVIIHPQSIIHSLLRMHDGSILAQISSTDMCGPISYALGFPVRELHAQVPELDFAALGSLTFFAHDEKKFPAITLAKQCIDQGPRSMALFNAANEKAVQLFRARNLGFTEIMPFIERTLEKYSGSSRTFNDLQELLELNEAILKN